MLRRILLLACTVVTVTSSVTDYAEKPQDETSSLVLLQTGFDFRSNISSKDLDIIHGSEAAAYTTTTHASQGHIAWETLLVLTVIACAVVTAVFYTDTTAGMAESMMSPQADLKDPQWTTYQKMFLMHRNTNFGQISEAAFRGACVFALYAIPFFLPGRYLPVIDGMIDSGVYSSFIGQLFLFTYLRTVGSTVCMGLQTLSGTLMAVVAIWLMFGIFPKGVEDDPTGSIFCFGIIAGSAFALSIIWLNFPLRVRIFALLRFTEYLMAFLNPNANVSANFSTGFSINLYGTCMRAVLATLAGSALALLANLLPYPHWSITAGQEDCFRGLGVLKEGWTTFYDFVNNPVKSNDMVNKLHRELFVIRQCLAQCDDHIAVAWWECFGMGVHQRKRVLISTVCAHLRLMYFQLLGASECCTADDTFAPEHAAFMSRIRAQELSLIERTGETLFAVIKHIEDPRPKELQSCVQEVQKAIATLTKDFHATKEELKIASVHEEYTEEHVFCRCECRWARMSCELAQVFINEHDNVAQAPLQTGQQNQGRRTSVKFEGMSPPTSNVATSPCYNGPIVSSVFSLDTIMQKDYMLTAGKLSVALFLCFAIGLNGYKSRYQTVITQYSFVIPGTFALLISPGNGVQLSKNLMRLEGVVLGTGLGAMLHAIFDACQWSSCIGSTVCIFVWIWINLIGHFTGREFAYLCFLLALFGQTEMVQYCGTLHKGPADSIEGSVGFLQMFKVLDFKIVFNVVTAIVIMTSCDLFAPTERASVRAADTITSAWAHLAEAFDGLFDPNCFATLGPSGEVTRLTNKAADLGDEAFKEMRIWRTSWRQETFNCCTDTLRLIRTSLYSIEDCADPCRPGCKHRSNAFTTSIESTSMNAMQDLVKGRLQHTVTLMEIFHHCTTSTLPELEYHVGRECDEGLEAAPGLVAADATREGLTTTPAESLEFDEACQISHILACFMSMDKQMKLFQGVVILHG